MARVCANLRIQTLHGSCCQWMITPTLSGRGQKRILLQCARRFVKKVHLIVADAYEYVERHRTTLLRKFANIPQKRQTLETYNTTETNNPVLIHRSPRPKHGENMQSANARHPSANFATHLAQALYRKYCGEKCVRRGPCRA